MNKLCRKWTSKASPRPFLILLNNTKQSFHARSSFKNKIFWNKIIKVLKKLTLCFLSNPVPFNGQGYQKQKGSGTSYQCLFRSRNKFRKIPSDQVWWCNVKQFLNYSKNYIWKFMHVNSWHHKLLHFNLFICIWKVWRGR